MLGTTHGSGNAFSAVGSFGNASLTASNETRMLRPPSGQRRTTGGNFVRENTVKSIWKRGGAAVNGWMGIPSSVAAEGRAQAGWDSLTADLQHGLIDYQTAVSLFQAVATTPTIPLARVPWNEPGVI